MSFGLLLFFMGGVLFYSSIKCAKVVPLIEGTLEKEPCIPIADLIAGIAVALRTFSILGGRRGGGGGFLNFIKGLLGKALNTLKTRGVSTAEREIVAP